MNLKTRLAKLETATQKTEPRKILCYVHGEQTLEEAKAVRGWGHIPDEQLKIIVYEVIE